MTIDFRNVFFTWGRMQRATEFIHGTLHKYAYNLFEYI